ncbi:TonB-dependent receptor [uncultured Sphingomonas sp.]|uniref:TonB-dependent receptor domain-containing protein n=1 Tax=uncultured Sphingomonas sp. TaxID=158754 RepID=UPI0025CFFAA8|nr:TonB-dependent receptor [uncultured Sphingomonas sp.]
MNRLYFGGAGLACLAVVAPANGQARDEHAYDLPAQPLGSALMAIARTTGQAVMVDAALVAGRRAPPLKGRFDAAGALARVLAGSGLRAEPINQGFVVRPSGTPQVRAEAEQSPDTDIVVTGSRIRGAPVASTLIVRTADTIRNEGQATLAEVIRTIPQNFGGGQNPGIGANVPAASGVNVGSGSSLNLRGLGSDATLTLLNGRRLAYSASRQSVDVSAIPVNAVERIEIVADGASALYGSDAIAGVANIRLRRDAQGLTTSARLGASTDGGNVEQVYGGVAGKRWSGGGMLLAYEFGHSTAIRAADRDYARDRVPGLDLYPSLRRHSVVLSGHQGLADTVELSLDLLYNNRRSFSQFPLSAAGVTPFRHAEQPSESDSAAIAPALRWSPGSWRFELAGSAGRDRVHYATNQFTGTQLTSRTFGCYCNDAHSVELAADGPLFALPGGPAKIALGVGYRDNRLVSQRGDNSAQNVDAHQDSRYAYAEASLPLIGPAQAVPLVHRLDASLALRHEDYPGIDAVTTPKLGLVYAPTPDVSLKASWGRSFRAPTLLQRYQPLVVAALPATVFGGTGLPSGATALLLSGGRDSLQPERARSWSTTVAIHPRAVDGLSVEISYFETLYRDRIVAPVTFIARALADPVYADQVLRAPGLATLESLRLGAGQFLNATGGAYDPTRVVAVIDNANRNAGRQRVKGLDMLARLDRSLGAGQVNATLSGAYLQSDQQLTPAQPVVDLAGTIFNPPHFRGRATLGWTQGGLTITGAVSRIDGVEDRRATPARRVGGMTQGDLTLRYRTGSGPTWWHGVDLVVTAQNILDAKPSAIATTLPYDTPYDSTNYSPLGHVLAISATKSW